MQTPPDVRHRWVFPESPLGRAAAAIDRLLADEAGEEDILAAEFHLQRAWDAYRWDEFSLTPVRARTRPFARSQGRRDGEPR